MYTVQQIKVQQWQKYLRQRWNIASQALIWDKNAFPKPCPSEAPFTRPAISVTLRNAGTLLQWQKKLLDYAITRHFAKFWQ